MPNTVNAKFNTHYTPSVIGGGGFMVKTIKVSDETHKALTTIPGELTSSSGRILTYDQVIKHLVDTWFKIGRKTMSKRAIPTDNVATKGEGRVGHS